MKRFALLCYLLFITSWLQAQTNYPSHVTVAQDGTGDYTTIQAAIKVLRAYSPVPLQVEIKKGVYHEKVVIPAWLTNVTFTGQDKDSTIITYEDYSGKLLQTDSAGKKELFTTFNSYTVWVQGNDVNLENLTIQNAAGRVGQAVALHVDGDRVQVRNCRLLGNQDTLLTANESSRQYYRDCYIEGTTDFIFGGATAVFECCTIKSLSNSYVTAASTSARQAYGYVFLQCTFTAAEAATSVYLGRPWRQHARVVLICCVLGRHIRPEGWENWRNPANEKTAYYAEYANTGEGAGTAGRVAWSHQLTAKQAKPYIVAHIFSGTTGWNPQTK